MAASFTLPILNKSQFLGQTHIFLKPNFSIPKSPSNFHVSAKFDLFQILGGRGLLNGEKGVEKELKRSVQEPTVKETGDETDEDESSSATSTTEIITEGGGDFEKELSGLTGGFPGGEKGLQRFIKNNPPLKKEKPSKANVTTTELTISTKKPKAPQLPLLMPGMIAIVKNENNPFYMYCGIVQRITDGKAGVLFEGGNWDRLVTFRLDELERREKGPPMKNPKSCVLEQPLP